MQRSMQVCTGEQCSHCAVGLMLAWCGVQAVPLPEVGGVPEDPGQLPQPDKLTKAYFEVCSLLALSSLNKSHTVYRERSPGKGGGGGGRSVNWSCSSPMA